MSITTDSDDTTNEFVPKRHDPKVALAEIKKGTRRSPWHGIAPEAGWDNPADMEEGRLFCENLSGICTHTSEDLNVLAEEIALPLRDLGISEDKAIALIVDHNKPPFSKAQVKVWTGIAYHVLAYNPPGRRSLTRSGLGQQGGGIEATPFVWREPSKIPQRDWIYRPAYVGGYVSLTTAAGGGGKSSLVRAECAAIASGKPLLGITPERRRVWCWNGEDPAEELERAFAAIRLHYELEQEDLIDWLFVDSGRDMPIKIANQDRNGFAIAVPVVDAIIAEIRSKEIGVMVVDPFVTSHNVAENDNMAMNEVVDQWRKIADATGAAVHLVHHTRKTNGEAATIEASRGASAVSSAARVRRAINSMTAAQAVKAGIVDDDRFSYISADYRTTSFIPGTDTLSWYKLVSVNLGNGPVGDGESIGVVTACDITELNLRAGDEEAALTAIGAGGPWRKTAHSGEAWVGYPIAGALGLNAEDRTHRKRLQKVIDQWLLAGLLSEVDGKDKQRKPCRFIVVGEAESDDQDFG